MKLAKPLAFTFAVLMLCAATTVVAGEAPAPHTVTPVESEHLKMLPIRAFQQTTSYTCGPAALITLLEYYVR